MIIGNKRPYVTYGVSAICIIIYALIHFTGIIDETNASIVFGAYYKAFILAGEYFRLLSVGFVHVTILHLFVNLISLMQLGSMLEIVLGHAKFILLLFVSILSGSLWVFILDGNVLSVGLSGGLYGLLACEIYILYIHGWVKHPNIRAQMINIIMINLLINLMPGISVSAHIGGFIGGLLFSCICIPYRRKDKTDTLKATIAFGLYVIGICYFAITNAYISNQEQYKRTDIEVLEIYQDYHLNQHVNKMIDRLDDIYGDKDISIYMKGSINNDGKEIY